MQEICVPQFDKTIQLRDASSCTWSSLLVYKCLLKTKHYIMVAQVSNHFLLIITQSCLMFTYRSNQSYFSKQTWWSKF